MPVSNREKPFLQRLYRGTGAKYLVRALNLRPNTPQSGSFTPLRDALAQSAGRSPKAAPPPADANQPPAPITPRPAHGFSPLRRGQKTPPSMPQEVLAAHVQPRAPAEAAPPKPVHRLGGHRPENNPLAQGLRQQPRNILKPRQAAYRVPAAMDAQQQTGVRRGSPTDDIVGRLAPTQPVLFRPASYDPQTGTIKGINGDLRLRHAKNAAAQGSFGRFYRGMTPEGQLRGIKQVNTAQHTELGHRGLGSTPPEMVQEEVSHMRRLGMNVYAIHETPNKMAFIEMDLYAGDLKQAFVHIPATLRASATRSALAQQAEQLAGLHAAGYMHRDIKSENTFFTETGIVQVADPGIATKLDPRRMHNASGTVAFMAPEVMATWHTPGHYDQKCDTWSLAVVACECLVKKPWPLRDKDLVTKARLQEALVAFRASVLRDGEVDMHAVARGKNRGDWHTYFYQMSLIDKSLCRFVLGRMFDPNPKTRATMQEVVRAANDLSSITRLTAPRQSVRAFQTAAQANVGYRREVSALQAEANKNRLQGMHA